MAHISRHIVSTAHAFHKMALKYNSDSDVFRKKFKKRWKILLVNNTNSIWRKAENPSFNFKIKLEFKERETKKVYTYILFSIPIHVIFAQW